MIFDKNVCSRLSFDVERAEMSLQDTFSRFECGNASINKYLSENALSDDETVTYIYIWIQIMEVLSGLRRWHAQGLRFRWKDTVKRFQQ